MAQRGMIQRAIDARPTQPNFIDRGVGNYVQNLANVEQEFQSGDRNVLEYILGTGYYGVAKPVEQAISAVIPDFIEEPIAQGVGSAMEATGIADAFRSLPPSVQRGIQEGSGLFGVTGIGGRVIGRTDPTSRGMFTSSGDVIVPGFYNPRDVKFPEAVENALNRVLPDPVVDGKARPKANKAQNALRKGYGFGEFGVRGIGRVASLMFNPRARALYTEYGISPVYREAYSRFQAAQDKYTKALIGGDRSDISKAMNELEATVQVAQSQMQQMANIKVQAGQTPRNYDATGSFALSAADPNVPEIYFQPNAVGKNWYDRTASQAANLRDVTPDESNFIQKHIEKAWGFDKDKTRIIVKNPRSDITGNHFVDVLGQNPALTPVVNLFKARAAKDPASVGQYTDVASLEADLKKITDPKRFQKEGKAVIDKDTGQPKKAPFRIVNTDETGVWITLSRPGRAKVEGGVNHLIKIEPNGNLTGVMSDVHDFLEKLPGLGQALSYSLPTTVVAVTPPMQANVFTVMGKGTTEAAFGPAGTARRIDLKTDMPVPDAARSAAAKERLTATAALRPSAGEVARQTVPVAQNVTVLGQAMAQDEEIVPNITVKYPNP